MSTATHEYIPGSDVDFDDLYRASYPRMLRSVGVMVGDWAEAEDCIQDAYVRAYRAWPRWRPDAPAEAWLWKITLNVVHTRMKQRQRRGIGEVLRRLGKPADAPDPANTVLRKDITDAFARLKPREVSAVVLRHVHGYSNVEIAASLGLNVRTITRLLDSAMERLRAELADASMTPSSAGGRGL